MADTNVIRAFKRFKPNGQKQPDFFTSGVLHTNTKDFEASLFDLAVVSGQKGWIGEGLKKPKTAHTNAWKHIICGLQEDPDDDAEHDVQFKEKGDKLSIVCAWKENSSKVFLRHQPLELEAADEGDVSTAIYDNILGAIAQGKEEAARLRQREYDCKKEAELAQDLVRDFIEKKAKGHEELYSKFALILNEKKKRIIELEKELAQLKGTPYEEAEEDQGEAEEEEEDVEQDSEDKKGGRSRKGASKAEGSDESEQEGDSDEEGSMATTVPSEKEEHDASSGQDDIMREDTEPLAEGDPEDDGEEAVDS